MVLCHTARVGDPANRLRLVVPAGGFIERIAGSRAADQVWERADPGLIGLGTDSLAVHRPIRANATRKTGTPSAATLVIAIAISNPGNSVIAIRENPEFL